jgi:type II secretory pathway pseudopilin PulG
MEILVVIVIIAILLCLLLPALVQARRWAKITATYVELKEIETSWKGYYSTYNKWPTFASESSAVPIIGPVARVLEGETDGNDNNPNKLKIMRFSKLNKDSDPINLCARSDTGIDYYYCKFDMNGDGVIKGTGAADEPPENDIHRKVIVWTKNPYSPRPGEPILGSWQK